MGLEHVVEGYTIWLDSVANYPPIDFYCKLHETASAYYKTALNTTKGIKYEKKDIEEFCKLISGDSKNIVALYISALTNEAMKEEDTITLNPRMLMNFLGYKHQKGKLVIEGNTGCFTCSEMTGGEVNVKGNAGQYTASGMTAGKLKVDGMILTLDCDIKGGEVWEKNRKVYTGETLIKNLLKKLGFKV